jgi:hypothetical protein
VAHPRHRVLHIPVETSVRVNQAARAHDVVKALTLIGRETCIIAHTA